MKYGTYEQMPTILNAEDIKDVLRISRAGAYKLMHSEGFPTIFIGKRMLVPRDEFIEWIKQNMVLIKK